MKDESPMDFEEIDEMPDESACGMILDMLKHMQQQITFMEKKVDIILSRLEGERSFDNARPAAKPLRKPYDKPLQRFDRPPRRGRNDGEDRERGYRDRDRDRDRESSRDNYFDRRKSPGRKPGGKPRSTSGKKPFHSRYSD